MSQRVGSGERYGKNTLFVSGVEALFGTLVGPGLAVPAQGRSPGGDPGLIAPGGPIIEEVGEFIRIKGSDIDCPNNVSAIHLRLSVGPKYDINGYEVY